MEKKPEVIRIGEDRIIVARGAVYRVKPFDKNFEFYFNFEDVCKVLTQLPFSFEVVPLNLDQNDFSHFNDNDPRRNLLEVYPEGRSSLEIYPPNFMRIRSIFLEKDGSFINELNPLQLMDDTGAGFRCTYAPQISLFGLENKSSKSILIELYKFSKQDAKRVYSSLNSFDDVSEESVTMKKLEKILERRK